MAVLSSDEEEADAASFGSRLSRFKKSPAKRRVYLSMRSTIRGMFIFIHQDVHPALALRSMTMISSSLTSPTRNHVVALHPVLRLGGVLRKDHLDTPPIMTMKVRMRTKISPSRKNQLLDVPPKSRSPKIPVLPV